VLAFAEVSGRDLAAWIADEARFPNSKVDRITPAPTTNSIAALAPQTGVDDRAALLAEAFRQRFIGDDFADGRPDWNRVSAQLVADVAPFEVMKLRLRDASHLAIAGPGAPAAGAESTHNITLINLDYRP
jgi:mannitol-1-phosphate/altronate dehydrogenase